ncbi:MAG: glycosyltransferase family 39 protein [Armatimonadetes bacterium]|nr:glycosyltransferase family 39 protein [Armatimonadota bacterium]
MTEPADAKTGETVSGQSAEGCIQDRAATTASTEQSTAGLLRDWRVHMTLVMLIALVPRVIYLAQIRTWQFFYYPVLDSRGQWKWGGILLERHLLGNQEVTGKAPLYSYWLALNQWMFQEPGMIGPEAKSLFCAHLLQLVLGAVTCGLTYLIGRRVYGVAEGWIAGLLLAAYSPGIYREGQLLDTALATFLAAAFVLAFFSALDRPELRGRWLLSGLLMGLLGLTRPNLLLLGATTLALMVIWLREPLGRKQLGTAMGVFLLGVILPIMPMAARNAVLLHRFVPISATGGINLYTGNNPDADGYSPIPSGIAWERTWYEARSAGVVGVAAHDAYWREKAMRFLRQQPLAALKLFVKKLYLYWNAYEIPNNISYDWGRRHSALLRAMPLTFALIGPLGLLGLVLGGTRSRRAWTLSLFVVAQMVAVGAFFVAARYRMPAMTTLCVFAAFGATQLVRLAIARRIPLLAVALVGLALSAAIVNSDLYGVRTAQSANRDYYYLGQSYLLAEDFEGARDALQTAVAEHPDDADAYALLGDVVGSLGDADKAAAYYRTSLEIAPDFALVAAKLVNVHLSEGWSLKEIAPTVREAVEAQPGHPYGLPALVRLEVATGDYDRASEALKELEKGLARISPSDTRANDMYGAAYIAVSEADAVGVEIPEKLRGFLR